jgi:hypothetical protein
MYELWATQGQGPGTKPDMEFATLEEALEHVDKHKGEAAFAIKYPDGTWHDWDDEDELQPM